MVIIMGIMLLIITLNQVLIFLYMLCNKIKIWDKIVINQGMELLIILPVLNNLLISK
jgi:hypothetical protein